MSVSSNISGKTYDSIGPFASDLETGVQEQVNSSVSPLLAEIDSLKQQISEIQSSVSTIQSSVGSLESSISSLEGTVEGLKTEASNSASGNPTGSATGSGSSSPTECVGSGGILSAALNQVCCDGLVEVTETRNGFDVVVCRPPTSNSSGNTSGNGDVDVAGPDDNQNTE